MAKTLDAVNTEEEQQRSIDSARAMDEYLRDIYDRKLADPDDGIFSALIAAEHDGDQLTKNEVISNIRLLYVAGHETTTNLIGNGLVELFRHPDQLEMIRQSDAHDANLVEEVLRFNSPVQMTRRIPDHDIEVEGTTIPGGSVVLLCAVSANRDPRKFGPTADEFDVTRSDAKDQVSFGGGPHFCLGAALARLEGPDRDPADRSDASRIWRWQPSRRSRPGSCCAASAASTSPSDPLGLHQGSDPRCNRPPDVGFIAWMVSTSRSSTSVGSTTLSIRRRRRSSTLRSGRSTHWPRRRRGSCGDSSTTTVSRRVSCACPARTTR